MNYTRLPVSLCHDLNVNRRIFALSFHVLKHLHIYICMSKNARWTYMSFPVEDDDCILQDMVNKAKIDSMLNNRPDVDDTHSQSVVSFLNKRFGSVSAFYNDSKNINEETNTTKNGFTRIKKLRSALAALDRGGWERSYHQRCFHEQFLNAVTKTLFKTDPPGSFERSYPRLLELNNWSEIRQEVLISTPRRFGKTISVCLFVAALMFACPSIEISIYSTCKRISCKLLRNCIKFMNIIADVLKVAPMPFVKQTMDEVEIQGNESKYDTRKLNSYPSKVTPPPRCMFCIFLHFWPLVLLYSL